MLIAIEQQMSAECIPGWMACDATTPPTGIVPGSAPEGLEIYIGSSFFLLTDGCIGY
jgi:hypothetical protein